MTRQELFTHRKETLESLQKLKERLTELNKKFEESDDDDRYGTAIMEVMDEIVDIQAELKWVNEELEIEKELIQKGIY